MRLGPKAQQWIWATVLIVSLVTLGIGWWWAAGDEKRALRALPDQQREGLYQRTMENLRTICDPVAPKSLREYCRAQAGFALQFDECDASCRETARRHLTIPQR
jgi:hypothetical protein